MKKVQSKTLRLKISAKQALNDVLKGLQQRAVGGEINKYSKDNVSIREPKS